MTEIVAAIIGGFLAAATGYIFERRREAVSLAKTKKLLCVGIKDDLQNSIELYDKLIEDYEKTQIVYLSTIGELKESRQTYNNNKDWITLFENNDLRKRIFRYYHRSTDLINLLHYREQRKSDLQQKMFDMVRWLMLNEQLEQEAAVAKASNLLRDEDNQYLYQLENIPKDVQKLKDFQGEAQRLLDEFS